MERQTPTQRMLKWGEEALSYYQGIDYSAASKVIIDGAHNLLFGNTFPTRKTTDLDPIKIANGAARSSRFFGGLGMAAPLVAGGMIGAGIFNSIINRFGDDSVVKQRMDEDGNRGKYMAGAALGGALLFGAAGINMGRYHAGRFNAKTNRELLASIYGIGADFVATENNRALRYKVDASNQKAMGSMPGAYTDLKTRRVIVPGTTKTKVNYGAETAGVGGFLSPEQLGLTEPLTIESYQEPVISHQTGKPTVSVTLPTQLRIEEAQAGVKAGESGVAKAQERYKSLLNNAVVPETYGANFAVGAAMGSAALGAGMAKGALDVGVGALAIAASVGITASEKVANFLFQGYMPDKNGNEVYRRLSTAEAMANPMAWSGRAALATWGIIAPLKIAKAAYDAAGKNKQTRASVKGITLKEARTPGDLGATGNIALNAYYNQKSVWS